jgi:hypothetical protein
VLFLVFSLRFFSIFCVSTGSFNISQIVSNFKLLTCIFHKYLSTLFTSFMIAFTSFCSLLFKLSVDKAHRVRYFIQILSAYSVIFTTLSAQALCHIIFGNHF